MTTLPKRMRVWNTPESKHERIVIVIPEKGRISCVDRGYENAYAEGYNYRVITWACCEELPEVPPEKHSMTRKEMLGFLANTPGLVTRTLNSEWHLPQCYGYELIGINYYQWATIDADGNIGEPQEFEK